MFRLSGKWSSTSVIFLSSKCVFFLITCEEPPSGCVILPPHHTALFVSVRQQSEHSLTSWLRALQAFGFCTCLWQDSSCCGNWAPVLLFSGGHQAGAGTSAISGVLKVELFLPFRCSHCSRISACGMAGRTSKLASLSFLVLLFSFFSHTFS